MSSLGIPLRTEWGAVKLNTSGTLSKDRLGQAPLKLVSNFVRTDVSGLRNSTINEAGSRVKVKTQVYEEVLKDATPSEEAVCPSLDLLAESNIVATRRFLGKIGSR